ncbi:MAG: NAD(P)/FAD-dependent oxidoreductase, partial [Caulobacteraceae bacterium]
MGRRARIVVAGAGALGSVIALKLAKAGFDTTAVDPAPLGDNASGVAAGMLAPAFESLFDEATRGRYALLAAARDLWPPLAAEIGLALAQEGALALGPREAAAQWAALLTAMGAEARLLSPGETGALSGLGDGAWSVFAPGDWRLEPRPALRLLKAAAERAGARFVAGRVVDFAEGFVALAGAAPLPADVLVLATGPAPLASIAPELATLAPVKGHILKAEGVFAPAPVVRLARAYLCRGAEGAILGATMEEGEGDPAVEPAVASRLLEEAADLAAGLGPLAWRAEAG